MFTTFRLLFSLLAALLVRDAVAFSGTGHHVIAVIGFELLAPEEQAEILRILQAHPRFAEEFAIPESIAGDPAAVARWHIGIAGQWPDLIRRNRQFDRPTWHYQLGANLVIGDAEIPDAPGPLPENATLDTQDLHIIQAIELCRRILNDRARSDADRAIAICWLAHLVADLHQPCHAGSLYSPVAFPDGDRGANAIKLTRRGNLHSLWDGLLGRTPSPGGVRRRVFDITSDPALSTEGHHAADQDSELAPEVWLSESRDAAERSFTRQWCLRRSSRLNGAWRKN